MPANVQDLPLETTGDAAEPDAATLRSFEDAVAAHLLRAFHAHTDLEPLLDMLHNQLCALTRVCGGHYRYSDDERGIVREYEFGDEDRPQAPATGCSRATSTSARSSCSCPARQTRRNWKSSKTC